MIDFVAIDFETANTNRDSACSVGLAVVEDGKLIKSFSNLICPPTLDFNRFNTQVHGLTEENVKNSPSFAELWLSLKPLISDMPLVAHNAPFDMSVLIASAKQARIELPEIEYFCTLKLCRTLMPGLHNHKLGTLAKLFGVHLNHHEAESDAIACAHIAIRLSGLASSIDFKINTKKLQEFCPQTTHKQSSQSGTANPTTNDIIAPANPDGRFNNLRFVLTGGMCFLTRSETKAIIEAQGGGVVSAVSNKTNYVVVGHDHWQRYQNDGVTTSKLKKALEVEAKDGQIKIIPEDTFYKLIEDSSPST